MPESGDPLVGTTVRDYEILEVLGRGGMGAVYRARHRWLKQERALKLIRTDLASEATFVERFLREGQVLASLESPHLVRLHELGPLSEHSFFMVMELLKGETVQQRLLARGRLEPAEAVRIVREAALALGAAHRKGVVHRDISPDNLYLVKDDEGREVTKVIDFGIAKPLGTEAGALTHTRGFIGKLEYASPEQCGALEDDEAIDGRSDVYSLGVTLYHMLAGRPPFRASSAEQYIYRHLNVAPEPLSKHVPAGAVPEALERVVLKALNKKRGDRQGSMAEFIAELDAAIAAAGPPRHVLKPGETFARRYRIDAKLGEGGMGAVYRAYDTLAQVPVALKLILRTASPSALERFRREAVLARKVAHAHVCRIHDLGEADGVHYVTMELLEGDTLGAYVQARGRLGVGEALGLFAQVVDGLAEAHRAGIVHRDLKPQNVMVDPLGRARIVDFGLALSADMERLTVEGKMVGTPLYMAPEQIIGREMDERTDLYALGVILFEMLIGRAPFAGRTMQSLLRAQVQEAPPAPSSLVAGIPEEVDALVLRCLEKAPEDRWPSAVVLLAAVREAQARGRRATERVKASGLVVEARERIGQGALTDAEALLLEASTLDADGPEVRALREELQQARRDRVREEEERRRAEMERERQRQEAAGRDAEARRPQEADRQAEARRQEQTEAAPQRRAETLREQEADVARAQRVAEAQRREQERRPLPPRKEEAAVPPKGVPPRRRDPAAMAGWGVAALLVVAVLGLLLSRIGSLPGPTPAPTVTEPATTVAAEPAGSAPPAAPPAGGGTAERSWSFDVVTVNAQGAVVGRQRGEALGWVEDVGGGVTLDMVQVPGGTFRMGSPDGEANRYPDEGPQHEVSVRPFAMGRFEVTQAQWAQVAVLPKVRRPLPMAPAKFKGRDRPVDKVSWDDSVEFCSRLSWKTGRTYRLPSEAEWEYACRAGTTTPFHFGPTITPELVNYDGKYPYGSAPRGQYRQQTTPVGSLGSANAFGLFDMHGNVWEWCQDAGHDSYNGAPADGSAWEAPGNGLRVVRGGAWNDEGGYARSAERSGGDPGGSHDGRGLRVVVSARTP
jgi:serine/threonine protein kinase/formylglycine-generating enzyme required for sulfatase activity